MSEKLANCKICGTETDNVELVSDEGALVLTPICVKCYNKMQTLEAI